MHRGRLFFLFSLVTKYDLTLVASDSLNESVTRVVILIKDSNDLPPIFNQTMYTANALEELVEPLPFKLLQVEDGHCPYHPITNFSFFLLHPSFYKLLFRMFCLLRTFRHEFILLYFEFSNNNFIEKRLLPPMETRIASRASSTF